MPARERLIKVKFPGWFCAIMVLLMTVGIALVIVCLNNDGLHRVDPWQAQSECLKVIATDEKSDHQLIDQLVGQNDKLTNKLLDQATKQPKVIHYETVIRISSSSPAPLTTNQSLQSQQLVPSPPPLSFSATISPSKDGITAEIKKGKPVVINFLALNTKSVVIRKISDNLWGEWVPISGPYTDSPVVNTGYEIRADGVDGTAKSFKFAAIVKKDNGLAAFLFFLGIAVISHNNDGPSDQVPPGHDGDPSWQHPPYDNQSDPWCGPSGQQAPY